MRGRLYLAIGLALGLTLVVFGFGMGPPRAAEAQTTCDRYVLGTGGTDTTDCSDETQPCATIQYAIDQAVDGDTVCVAKHSLAGPLTYNERLTITRSIELNGAWDAMCVDPNNPTCSFTAIPCDPANVTVDAEGTGRVVTIDGDITPTIDCFTITGGDADEQFGGGEGTNAGGGIYSYDAAPIIVNNVITANYGCNFCTSTYGHGGGVYLYNAPSTAVISGNVIANNVADESTWGQGGGIYLWHSDAQILHNTIASNRAGHSVGYGGGIAVLTGTPTIADNLFEYNYAGLALQGLGGAIFVWSPDSVTIERNVLRYNQALHGSGDPNLSSYGGGIYYEGKAPVSPIIRDNVVYYNLASISDSKDARGGGVYLHNLTSSAIVSGNRIEWNQSCNSCDGYGGGIYISDSEITFENNHLESNAASWAGSHGMGGGIYVDGGAVVLQSNVITGNAGRYFSSPSIATGFGGGIALTNTVALIQENQVVNNMATAADGGAGGGIYASSGSYNISGNIVQGNRASGVEVGVGGGIYTDFSSAWIDGNVVLDNRAAPTSTFSYGGGVRVGVCDPFTLTNNIVARNGAADGGSGIAITSSDGVVAHNTVAENTAGDDVGIAVQNTSVVTLYNNIVTSQTVGIYNLNPGTASARARYTLFEGNGTDTVDVNSTEELPGPAMLLPNYHIAAGSNAINMALNLGWLTHDIDGDPRPLGSAPDVGADEFSCLARTGGMDYATIQGAIDAATSGATVMVAEGTCYENLSINKTVALEGGWNTTFASRYPSPALHTTIDGIRRGRVISITETAGSIAPSIDGLTITGGDATGLGSPGLSGYDAGGGIFSYRADTTVSDCIVRDSVASTTGVGWGGGLGFIQGNVTVQDTVIEDNTASTFDNGYGGGLFIREAIGALSRNTVQRNVGTESGVGYGGGLSFIACTITTEDNLVRENLGAGATSGAFGGGVRAHMTVIDMNGDVIEDNQAYLGTSSGYGGGFAAQENSNVTMDGVWVSGNEAPLGGGIFLDNSPGATVTNSDVFSNTASLAAGIDLFESPNVTLTANRVYSNVATYGAGVVIHYSNGSTLDGNEIHDNSADINGGGVVLLYSHNNLLTGNAIYGNEAGESGGGLYATESPTATIEDNALYENAAIDGPALSLYLSGGTDLVGNEVYHNTGGEGDSAVMIRASDHVALTGNEIYSNGGGSIGAIWLLESSHITLTRNLIYSNTARSRGGGLFLDTSEDVLLVNNVVADNEAGNYGSGLHADQSSATMLHTTVARNGGGADTGIFVDRISTVDLVNTIIVGHGTGIDVSSTSTATFEATLWGTGAWANTVNWTGSGTLNPIAPHIYELPAFFDADGGDYHIRSGSGAIDAGVDAGVSDDIDGDRRPFGGGFDIGADEMMMKVFLPLVMRDS